MGAITLHIEAENEHDLCRILGRLGSLILAENMAALSEQTNVFTPDDAPPTQPDDAPPAQAPPTAAPEPRKQGRPKGSTNKPKTNGGEPQTQTSPAPKTQPSNSNGLLALAEQIQIITDATHDQPDKFKPLLVPLRDKLGVQYISKAGEKDRPALQEFINEHGLAV